MTTLIAVALVGAITRYDAPTGAPLKCGGVYDDSHAWIAMADPRFTCGQWVRVYLDGYAPFTAQVLDSGGFAGHCVRQLSGKCLPIVADIPTHAAPFAPDLSVTGRVVPLHYNGIMLVH